MSRSAIRERPKNPSKPLGRPVIAQRFRMRILAELRGSFRMRLYAWARCSGVVLGFLMIITSSRRLAACFAVSFFRRSFRITAEVFAISVESEVRSGHAVARTRTVLC
jgi:hypothetical protein